MRLPAPDRQRQRQRAAEDGAGQADQDRTGRHRRVDAAEERRQRQHRGGAGDQAEHRHQPRRQLAQHDLGVGQVGRELYIAKLAGGKSLPVSVYPPRLGQLGSGALRPDYGVGRQSDSFR